MDNLVKIKPQGIENLSEYCFEIDSELILDFLKQKNDLNHGEKMKLSEKITVIKLTGFAFEEHLFECHHKFCDVHYTIDGIDNIILGNNESKRLNKSYNSTDDYELWLSTEEKSITIEKGKFVFIPTKILHSNKFISEVVTKYVFKLNCDA